MLLDDELPGLTYLKMLCEQMPELEVVKAFNNPEVLLRELPGLDFDLCILDIEMPGMSGLHIANLLREKPVIFVTAYKEYAADAFDLDAVDYVQKPVKRERLQQAVNKVLNRAKAMQPAKTFVQVNTEKGKALLFFEHIAFVETSAADSRDKVVWMKDGSTLTLKNISFDRLFSLLPPGQLSRVNKRQALAIAVVRFYAHDEVTTGLNLPSGKPLKMTLSDIYREEFIHRLGGRGH